MSADQLLARLQGVKRTGEGRWLARCPAHDDRHPSLSVRETADGTVLLKCWTGCSAAEVVAAVGLELADLFPAKTLDGGKPERRPFPATDILLAVRFETMIVSLAAVQLAKGKRLADEDYDRLKLAASRLQAAAEGFD